MPNMERSRICEVPCHKGYFFDNGHADANTSLQSLVAWDVAEIVAKQCAATGTGLTHRLFTCTDVVREGFCFSEGFFTTWTNYQDMRTGLFISFCAICASGGSHIWLS
jgi:hypothetical protein